MFQVNRPIYLIPPHKCSKPQTGAPTAERFQARAAAGAPAGPPARAG